MRFNRFIGLIILLMNIFVVYYILNNFSVSRYITNLQMTPYSDFSYHRLMETQNPTKINIKNIFKSKNNYSKTRSTKSSNKSIKNVVKKEYSKQVA